jgi:hypothetical protein
MSSNHLYLVGKIYQRFAGGMMTAPTNEILTAILKLLKTSTEVIHAFYLLVVQQRIHIDLFAKNNQR